MGECLFFVVCVLIVCELITSFGAFNVCGQGSITPWWMDVINKGESPWRKPGQKISTSSGTTSVNPWLKTATLGSSQLVRLPAPDSNQPEDLINPNSGSEEQIEWPTAAPWHEETSQVEPTIKDSTLRECGKRENHMLTSWKIIGGEEEDLYTMEGDIPWMLALRYEEPETKDKSSMTRLLGGATLIHRYFAITTASLVYGKKPENLKLYAGEWDVGSDVERIPVQVRNVTRIITHGHFVYRPRRYDIALLVVDEMFELSESVNTVCLPKSLKPFETAHCFVSGWGAQAFNEKIDPTKQHTLKMGLAPIIPKKECEEKIRKTTFGTSFKLHRSSLCAGGNGEGPCMGDTGGPLFCDLNESQTFFLIGLVSWSVSRCSGLLLPDIYTSVAYFKDWIDSTIEDVFDRID